jgi:alcohol dehydrogenase class IV
MAILETSRPAFNDRPKPMVVFGLPFEKAAAKYIELNFHSSRVYLLLSKSLHNNTDSLRRLKDSLGAKLVGTRIGLTPYTQISEVLEVVHDARKVNTDLLLTVGGGSLTDCAKIVSYVREYILLRDFQLIA